jgi:hypothetical protein
MLWLGVLSEERDSSGALYEKVNTKSSLNAHGVLLLKLRRDL